MCLASLRRCYSVWFTSPTASVQSASRVTTLTHDILNVHGNRDLVSQDDPVLLVFLPYHYFILLSQPFLWSRVLQKSGHVGDQWPPVQL